MDPILSAVFLATMTITSYRSVPNQTDSSPWITSIGERVNNHGIAVSQDLLRSGKVHYGDTLLIEGYGLKTVNDCMNARIKNAVDIWVATKEEEHKVGVRRLRVWRVRCDLKKSPEAKKGRHTLGSMSASVTTRTQSLKKTQEQIQMFSVMNKNLTPGTDWQLTMRRTSTPIIEP